MAHGALGKRAFPARPWTGGHMREDLPSAPQNSVAGAIALAALARPPHRSLQGRGQPLDCGFAGLFI